MRVLIVGGNQDYLNLMAKCEGVTLAESYEDSDCLLFTGGSDVNPELYGESKHPRAVVNMLRDTQEKYLYEKAVLDGKKFIGICRGGQFLNVMNGGRLFQHVDNHAIYGTHEATTEDGRVIQVTSTHHQMMIPTEEGRVLACAKLSTERESMHRDDVISEMGDHDDVEVVYYPKTRSLCFQPHPEFNYNGVDQCKDYFYELVKNLVL